MDHNTSQAWVAFAALDYLPTHVGAPDEWKIADLVHELHKAGEGTPDFADWVLQAWPEAQDDDRAQLVANLDTLCSFGLEVLRRG